ncbi:MAG: sulfatase-like hydrolase/transferase [Bacteroidales bacterium]|nr:sulfatase-like hydrolase/transferase [Bacteroidales bacterium]MCF8390681.1 sulfatase-like hydrolase/transferase [Bacteroidales bacterium]
MKNGYIFIFISLLLLGSCSGFQGFDSESAIKIELKDSIQLVNGLENWSGPDDCSSVAYLNKTPAGLLFTIEVFDDSIKTGNPASYMNDGVELYFDMRPPRLRERNIYQSGVFQAVILPEPGKKQMAPIEWFPSSYQTGIPGTRAYTELREKGYVVQVTIPYTGLKRNHFWPRTTFYMDVAINDADTGARESQIMWRGKNDNWNKPHNFAQVQFMEEEKKESKKPNIILILTDQQTINAMGAYGNPYVKTPNMNALAKHGVRFTKSYSTSSICGPARSSILTGRMPHETGVNYNGQEIDSSVLSLGEYMKAAGYYTTWAGKWGLTEDYPQDITQEIRGFKHLQFMENRNTSNLGEITDKSLGDAIVKFLKGRRRQPFLLAVSFQYPQDISLFPVNPEAFSLAPQIESTPPLPNNHEIIEGEAKFIRDARTRATYHNEIAFTQNYTDDDWRNYLFLYYRMIENLDQQVGKIITTLEKEGLDENTLIIFTSDHGDGAASHKWAGKLSLYEESIKVPAIITWFGKTPINKTDSEHLVSGLDILPTIMDYAGVEIPESIEGMSWKSFIEVPDTSWRKFLVTELAIDPADSTKTGLMITNGRYKYIQYSYGGRSEQLFNLDNDAGETLNLIDKEAYSGIQNRLKFELEKWMLESDY